MFAWLKKRKYAVSGFIAAFIVISISIFPIFSSSSNATVSVTERVLNVIPLKSKQSSLTTTHIGYITPINSVEVVPNVSGYIQDVLVEGGQQVRVGDNLLLIDQREYKANLAAAEATVTQAQANLNNADVYYRRIKKAGSKAVSPTELDNAKAKYLSALGELKAAEANRDKAKVMYDYTILQATIDGIVGNVNLTAGNYVAPASPALFSIVQTNPIRVVFSLTNKDYLNILSRSRNGDILADYKINLQLPDGKKYEHSGKFQFTDNAIDKSTGSISVYVDFINPDKKLISGGYVDVLLERDIKDGFWVPQNSVYLTPLGAFIYVVKDNKVSQKEVNIVSESEGEYLLDNKFADDEFLVTDRVTASILKDKVRIKVNSAEQP